MERHKNVSLISALGKVNNLTIRDNSISWTAPHDTKCPVDGYTIVVTDLQNEQKTIVKTMPDDETAFTFKDASADTG